MDTYRATDGVETPRKNKVGNKISGHVGAAVSALVSYVHTKQAASSQNTADAAGNHSSASTLPPGTYIVTAQAPGRVFNSVAVIIDAANPQDQVVNLRSRLLNADNSQGF